MRKYRYDDADDDDYEDMDSRYRRRSRGGQGTGMAVTSLVLGILSVVLFCFWFVGVPLGILAIIFGSVHSGREGKGMATAGLVLGAVSLALTIVFYGVWIAGMGHRGFFR